MTFFTGFFPVVRTIVGEVVGGEPFTMLLEAHPWLPKFLVRFAAYEWWNCPEHYRLVKLERPNIVSGRFWTATFVEVQ